MMDLLAFTQCHPWALAGSAGFLVLEWWLPRQNKIKASSTLELVWLAIVLLGTMWLLGVIAILSWRKK